MWEKKIFQRYFFMPKVNQENKRKIISWKKMSKLRRQPNRTYQQMHIISYEEKRKKFFSSTSKTNKKPNWYNFIHSHSCRYPPNPSFVFVIARHKRIPYWKRSLLLTNETNERRRIWAILEERFFFWSNFWLLSSGCVRTQPYWWKLDRVKAIQCTHKDIELWKRFSLIFIRFHRVNWRVVESNLFSYW